MADNNSMRLQEGVQTSEVAAKPSSEGQIKRTTAAATALLALTLYAGIPAPAKAETPADSKAVATFVVNAEYEAIIAEAKKQGKNPVEVAMIMKQDGKFTFAQFRAFSKYYGDQIRTEQIVVDRKIEEGTNALLDKGRTIIVIFEGLIRDGKFTEKEVAIINDMYSSTATPKIIKDELYTKFGKYIGKGMTIAQNTTN